MIHSQLIKNSLLEKKNFIKEIHLPEVGHGSGKWSLGGDVGRIPWVMIHLQDNKSPQGEGALWLRRCRSCSARCISSTQLLRDDPRTLLFHQLHERKPVPKHRQGLGRILSLGTRIPSAFLHQTCKSEEQLQLEQRPGSR